MSWLKKRAEEAAKLCESQTYGEYPTVEQMAPHIEAAMRDFAERAVNKYVDNRDPGWDYQDTISKAIAEADKESE
jgi:hypothetical protein